MIGVFGDSFVEYHYKLYPTWFSDYETYGFGGSDIWYSYNKFMENRKYRKTINIFPHKILKNSVIARRNCLELSKWY